MPRFRASASRSFCTTLPPPDFGFISSTDLPAGPDALPAPVLGGEHLPAGGEPSGGDGDRGRGRRGATISSSDRSATSTRTSAAASSAMAITARLVCHRWLVAAAHADEHADEQADGGAIRTCRGWQRVADHDAGGRDQADERDDGRDAGA